MSAKDYTVKHKYGATYSPWTTETPHRGNDRPTPSGTPVAINGQVIGKTGNTGESSAPHLHTQAGTDQGTQNTVNPTGHEFQSGVVVATRLVDSGQWGKFITIKNDSGMYVTYAHLSEINVSVGQRVGEAVSQREAEKVVTYLYRLGTGAYPNPGQAEYWVPRVRDVPTGIDELGGEMLKAQKPAQYEPVTETLYRRVK